MRASDIFFKMIIGKKIVLFFDTETTGLPRSWNAPVSDVDNWPRLVQLATVSYSFNERPKMIRRRQFIIRPNGFEIPEASSRIHGITTERARAEGVPVREALKTFYSDVVGCDMLVGHNIDFDKKIVGAELIRAGFPPVRPERRKICTMKESIRFCALPRYKWPKLVELHHKLFGRGFEGAHDAMNDVEATAACFWGLVERGVIKI